MHRIVILGAGYAGMAAAMSLAGRTRRREDVRITLVNAGPRFTERLRLHQVAAGERLADRQLPDLLRGTGIQLEIGWVTAIDAQAGSVRVDDERDLGYDTLVYALGGVADVSTPGAADHAYTLDSDRNAEMLAGRVREAAGGAVVVGGSGLTGVETAAEIASLVPASKVTLVGRSEPGSEIGPRPRAYLQQWLRKAGVGFQAGSITKVLPDGVELATGEIVPADVVVWTTGVRVSPLAGAAGLTVDGSGRIVTDETLRSVSHPSIYAVGDAAAIEQSYGVMHGTCQSGMPTGVAAARSIARALDGRDAKGFRYGYVHTPISLGREDAVIQFTHRDQSPGRFYLTGRAATWYKETASSAPWPSFGRLFRMPAIGVLGWRR
jgi:NADH:ubiquinone reductase (H+-translocating)